MLEETEAEANFGGREQLEAHGILDYLGGGLSGILLPFVTEVELIGVWGVENILQGENIYGDEFIGVSFDELKSKGGAGKECCNCKLKHLSVFD